MSFKKDLYNLFNIREEETTLVGLLLVHSIFVGIAIAFFFNAGNALFVARFGGDKIPHAFILTGITGYLLGVIFSKLQKKIPFSRLIFANLIFLLASLIFFYFGITFSNNGVLIFGIFIWIRVFIILLRNLEFGGLVNRVLTLTQLKRLNNLINSGEAITSIIAFFSISLIVPIIGTNNLILISIFGLSLCLVMFFIIHRKFSKLLSVVQPRKRYTAKPQKQVTNILKNPYVLNLMGLLLLSTLALYLVNYEFLKVTKIKFVEQEKISQFISIFYGLLYASELIFKTFFSARILKRYGLQFGLMFLPVVLAAFMLIGITNDVFWGSIAVLFWIIAATKLFDWIFRKCIYDTSYPLLYQPFPPEEKSLIQTNVESKIRALGICFSGLMILGIKLFRTEKTLPVYILILITLVGWLIFSKGIYKKYTKALSEALKKHTFSGEGVSMLFSLRENQIIELLKEKLQADHPGEVIYSLNTLEKLQPSGFSEILVDLLEHPLPLVRREVLQKIREQNLCTALNYVRNRVRYDEAPKVRAEAIKTLCALEESEVVDQVYPYLSHSNREVRLAAIVGLLRYGGIEAILPAGGMLMVLVDSDDPEDRKLSAEVVGEVGISNFYRPLLKLMKDDNLEVKRKALEAAGKIKNPKLADLLIQNLHRTKFSNIAVASLVSMGNEILPNLEMAFDMMQERRNALIRIIRIFGKIGGVDAISVLKEKIDYPDEEIRLAVYISLNLCGYIPGKEDRALLEKKIYDDLEDITWAFAAYEDLTEEELFINVRNALYAENIQGLRRIFYLISFLYNTKIFIQVWNTLSSQKKDPAKIAYAIEMVEVTLSQDWKELILPLIEDSPPDEKLQKLIQHFPQKKLDTLERLKEIISRSDELTNPWTKSCAMYCGVKLGEKIFFDVVVNEFTSKNALVRETAIWAAYSLDQQRYFDYTKQLENDPVTMVARTVDMFNPQMKESNKMLLTIEKVLFLKTVDVFSKTPEEVLADLALIIEEVNYKKGEKIIEKDELGSCMYMIYSGKVRVHDGDLVYTYLEEKSIFGEIAVFESQPIRTASITAETDTMLLRLDQEPFYELMADRVEIARGIIQSFSRRVREQNAQIIGLLKQLQ